MKKFLSFIRDFRYLLLLLIIAIISHFQWFNLFSVLNSSDWVYWPDEAVNQLYNSYGSWVNFLNFGSVNIQIPFNFFTLIWCGISNLGFSYDFATKITFLIPIAILGFISPYVLFKKLTQNELIAFTIALFYGTTTHFLVRQTAHMPIAFVYALTPLIFYIFIRALEKKQLVNWMLFILIYWIGACYEIRITYIVTFILFFYFIFFHASSIKKHWKNFSIITSVFIGLNIFWLFPMIFGDSVGSISSIANRGLFGNFLFDLRNAFTLSESSWTGGLANNQFIKQTVFWYFWLVPIICFSSLFFKRNNKYKKNVTFFGVLSLLGIFLTKQAAEPLPSTYFWLYTNFPGFNLFREASKFYLITAIGYSGLLGYGLLILKENKDKIWSKYVYVVVSIIIIILSLWNIKPLITGEIGTMFVKKNIPQDYLVLKDFILNQSEYFRTMWVPRDSRWGIYTNQKPKISNVSIIDGDWKGLLGENNENYRLSQDRIINTYKTSFADNLFDDSSIKYVIVPIQDTLNSDDFFVYYGGDKNPNIRQWYIEQLDKVSWLKKIDIGTKDLVVYENKDYKQPIFSFSKLYNFDSLQNLNGKYDFTKSIGNSFYFVSSSTNKITGSLTKVSSLFENTSLKGGSIIDNLNIETTRTKLYTNLSMSSLKTSLYLNNKLLYSGKVSFGQGESVFEYKDPKYKFGNIINNPSFEDGVWQDKVGDCNNFDNNPVLGASLNKDSKTDGRQSLQLEATKHIACMSVNLNVFGGGTYLFNFDYQSPNADYSTYYLGFNDENKTVIEEYLPIKDKNWNTFSKTIKVPEGATSVSLYIYADSTDGKTNIINRYDNFKMIEVPDLSNAYYLVSDSGVTLKEPTSITFDLINPTKKLVHIKGATTPFYLAMGESYHDQWQLQFNNSKVNGFFNSWVPFVKPDRISDAYHYKLNDFLNAWYVDTGAYCAQNTTLCTKNADGSYDIEMVIEFFPQRWFYFGLLISGTILVGCLGYLGYEGVRIVRRKLKKKNEKNN